MKPDELADFEAWLLNTGSQIYASTGSDSLSEIIQSAKDWLVKTNRDEGEHLLTLAMLMHAYRSLGLHQWNKGIEGDVENIRQAIELSLILTETVARRKSPLIMTILQEQQLWLCQRYEIIIDKPFKRQKCTDPISPMRLENLIAENLHELEKGLNFLAQRRSEEVELLVALIQSRLEKPRAVTAGPMLEWWKSGVDDRSIALLRSIRLGGDVYFKRVWQWQLEILLKSIDSTACDGRYGSIIDRIAVRQSRLSNQHLKGKSDTNPDREAWVFWARCDVTMQYKGYRVYASVVAQKPKILDVIIDETELTTDQKNLALLMIDPMCIFSKSAQKRYLKKLDEVIGDQRLSTKVRLEFGT